MRMMRYPSSVLAALAVTARAAKDQRTFAVLRFYGDGPLMEGRVDPIVSPGETAPHVHTIMGGSGMGVSATGEGLMGSGCSNALVAGDNSGYWVPKLYFHDRAAATLEPVDLFYMNVYYFFEPTDDDVEAFPVGLQVVSGDAGLRTCPDFGGALQTDGAAANATGVQPTQWTCPRSSSEPPSWPPASQSDGSRAGIQDPANRQAGQGFPFSECDGYASPLRQDLHFPSCYDRSKALTDHAHNMAFPAADPATGRQNCPEGFAHVPHLFFEAYWNTPPFRGRWEPDRGYQPFVLSSGDLTGCSAHGDFLAAWDTGVLQGIIDGCDAGDAGMDTCPGVAVRDRSGTCKVESPIREAITGNLTALPGDNPLVGWGLGDDSSNTSSSSSSSSSSTGGGSGSGSSSSSSSSSPSVSGYPTFPSGSARGTVAASSGSFSYSSPSSPSSSSAAAAVVASGDGSGDDDNEADVVSSPPPSSPAGTAGTAGTATPGPRGPVTTAGAVTTLPDGSVSTVWDTVWDTVTVTRTVYDGVVGGEGRRAVGGRRGGGGGGHEHGLRHRSPHVGG